jgi:hypothetical protein
LTVISGAVTRKVRELARPPRQRPAPAESGRNRYSSTRNGYFVSKISTGVLRQLPLLGQSTLLPSWSTVPPQPLPSM